MTTPPRTIANTSGTTVIAASLTGSVQSRHRDSADHPERSARPGPDPVVLRAGSVPSGPPQQRSLIVGGTPVLQKNGFESYIPVVDLQRHRIEARDQRKWHLIASEGPLRRAVR